jgi:predicted TIM-barrel fold metal-dependent hydrolase
MKLIAIEEHFLMPEVSEAWAAARAPLDPSCAFHGGELGARLRDLGQMRLELMDETGVDVQVLSLTTPGLHNLDAVPSTGLAKRTNDLIASTIASAPTRFQGFAALPTPAPQEVVRELERAVRSLGLKGAMVCGRTREKNLDHSDFWPMFECAAHMNVPIFVHPQMPAPAVRAALYAGLGGDLDLALAGPGLGWHYEAGLQFVRLVVAGVFDRFPNLQIILGHWGEMVLFYLERLGTLDRVARLKRPVADYVRRNLYVTASGMFSDAYLQRCVDIVGIDRVLFSTDYPYQYRAGRDARRFLEQAPLENAGRAKFAHRNWQRLTGEA